MTNCNTRLSCEKLLLAVAAVAFILCFGGCSDYIPEKATELQARSILNNLSRVQPVPDPNISIPEVYTSPPVILQQTVGDSNEFKLFYFCRHHTSDKLQSIVQAQFAATLFGKKGQETTPKDYTITANNATNQLIIRCPKKNDAEAVLDLLKATDVPPIQVRIDCMISELYADLTMDKEITLKIENLFGQSIALGGKVEGGELLPAFPGAALREPARDKFGLKIGFGHQLGIPGHEFQALIDLLISRGYLKILMNPTLEVVNGQTARIETKEHVPLQTISIRGALDSFLETRTEYYDIIDSLEVTPHVFADGYIGLQTDAKISAKLTPEGIVQRPIVTERTISNKENRIRHGESLIIGGIRKSEKRDVIRGVPVLKDIPVIGGLFSGRDFEERAKEVIFILTPTISTGGVPNNEIVDMIREKHEPPLPYEDMHKAILDPFGFNMRERERQRQLLEAEESRMVAEAEKAKARTQVRQADERTSNAQQEVVTTRQQLDALRAEVEQIRAEAATIKVEADKLTAEAAAAKLDADKATAEAEAARQEATKVEGEAPKVPDSLKPELEKEAPAAKPAEKPAAQKPAEVKPEGAAVETAGEPVDAGTTVAKGEPEAAKAAAEVEKGENDTAKADLPKAAEPDNKTTGASEAVVEVDATANESSSASEKPVQAAAKGDSDIAASVKVETPAVEITAQGLWYEWMTLYADIFNGRKPSGESDGPDGSDQPGDGLRERAIEAPLMPDPVIRDFKEV